MKLWSYWIKRNNNAYTASSEMGEAVFVFLHVSYKSQRPERKGGNYKLLQLTGIESLLVELTRAKQFLKSIVERVVYRELY